MEFASFYNVDINRPKQTINFKTKANLQQRQRKTLNNNNNNSNSSQQQQQQHQQTVSFTKFPFYCRRHQSQVFIERKLTMLSTTTATYFDHFCQFFGSCSSLFRGLLTIIKAYRLKHTTHFSV